MGHEIAIVNFHLVLDGDLLAMAYYADHHVIISELVGLSVDDDVSCVDVNYISSVFCTGL